MGVYVKEMKIPRGCGFCPLCSGVTLRCFATYEGRYTNGGYDREPWCPLVEIKSPHGRLIDADAIDTSYSDPEVVETLREAPTIIEAEN